jgi:hypothetical protein
MPHRVKNKHRARHRSHTVKAANLSAPVLPEAEAPADQQNSAPASGKAGAATAADKPAPAPAAA